MGDDLFGSFCSVNLCCPYGFIILWHKQELSGYELPSYYLCCWHFCVPPCNSGWYELVQVMKRWSKLNPGSSISSNDLHYWWPLPFSWYRGMHCLRHFHINVVNPRLSRLVSILIWFLNHNSKPAHYALLCLYKFLPFEAWVHLQAYIPLCWIRLVSSLVLSLNTSPTTHIGKEQEFFSSNLCLFQILVLKGPYVIQCRRPSTTTLYVGLRL